MQATNHGKQLDMGECLSSINDVLAWVWGD
jgi:hypothetical protein